MGWFKVKKAPVGDEAALPDQAELRAQNLKPGKNVDLVLGSDLALEGAEVRASHLHGLTPKGYLILAQSFPRVGGQWLGKPVRVTFLSHHDDVPGGRWLRTGYGTRIYKMVDDHQLSDTLTDDIILVGPPEELERSTLRLHFRMSPPKDQDLRLYIWPERTKVGIIDISQGGVCFSHPRAWSWRTGSFLNLLLVSHDQETNLTGRVVREGPIGKNTGRGFTAVQLEEMSASSRRQLARILNGLVRRGLIKRSGLTRKRLLR